MDIGSELIRISKVFSTMANGLPRCKLRIIFDTFAVLAMLQAKAILALVGIKLVLVPRGIRNG